MALRAIKDFPKATPSTEDLILIEQQGGGRSTPLSELPVSTPVNTKITGEVNSLKSRIDNIMASSGDDISEIVDARQGSDGTNYASLKARLDAENNELKGDVDELREYGNDTSDDDKNDALYVTDKDGNLCLKIDINGVHANAHNTPKGGDVVGEYDNEFYITDADGYIIFKADRTGVHAVGLDAVSASQYAGMKLLTYGDSLSAHDGWAKWLVEWLGVSYDLNETLNGKDGHAVIAKGGTSVNPATGIDSIYMRMLDVQYYLDNDKGTVIMVFAGANDAASTPETIGTINDTPYTSKSVPAYTPTFCAAYMGMIENLMADAPTARVFLLTHPHERYEIGGDTVYGDVEYVKAYEAKKTLKRNAIRDIAKKYNLPLIDLERDSGINIHNMNAYYNAGPTGHQIHCNDYGYKRLAETMVQNM